MPNDNAQIIRGGYDAFATGDSPAVLGMLSEQIAWHVPGRSALSETTRGQGEALGFFGKSMELSGGTLTVEVDEMLTDGERVVG
jgi:ketosteroid isomerase-like protein